MFSLPSISSLSSYSEYSALWGGQLSLLLESTGEGIFGIDLEGRCVFINRSGARLLGYDAVDVLGLNMHDLTHHSHPDGSHYSHDTCPIFNAFRKGLHCRIDSEVFWRKDKSSFPVEYSSYPIIDNDKVRGAVVTFVDITERKLAAESLRIANERLARINDELESHVEERTVELSTALAQLRKLSAYSEIIREEERTRIAREIHDELGSLLVAMKMDVNWIKKRLLVSERVNYTDAIDAGNKLRVKCQKMGEQIETAVTNVGRIITDLRPSILDHQGLWAALEWQATEFSEKTELQLDWYIQGVESLMISEQMSISIFRIFQEMLSNVARHANASRIEVHIKVHSNELHLFVRDNGSGANGKVFESSSAYGVMGMRERARQHGGQLFVNSQIGEGTLFFLRIPVR